MVKGSSAQYWENLTLRSCYLNDNFFTALPFLIGVCLLDLLEGILLEKVKYIDTSSER